jgi:hypothetical protein
MSLSDRDWAELPTVMGGMETHRRLIISAGSGAVLTPDALQFISLSIVAANAARDRLQKAEPLTD